MEVDRRRRATAKYPIDAKDPYVDPDTGVLRNRFGIRDQAELDRVEATFAAVRSYELAVTPMQGQFDLGNLQHIHKRLFGDVHDWAGALRNVDISKGSIRFASHEQIALALPLRSLAHSHVINACKGCPLIPLATAQAITSASSMSCIRSERAMVGAFGSSLANWREMRAMASIGRASVARI